MIPSRPGGDGSSTATAPEIDPSTILREVRRCAVRWAGDAWHELGVVLGSALAEPLDPVVTLPLATGVASGGGLEDVLPVAAAVVAMGVALRTLDDLADDDHDGALHHIVGTGRSANAATALSILPLPELMRLPLPPERREAVIDAYCRTFLQVCGGQDDDMRGVVRSLADYRGVVATKTVPAYRFAGLVGALAVGAARTATGRSAECGAHLGWMVQIMDDIEALWFADPPTDLERGRLTFPVALGLSLEHPDAAELAGLCAADRPDAGRICVVLDRMQVRARLMRTALDHRDAALAALGPPLDERGRALLTPFVDWLLRDGDRLIGPPSG